MKKKLIMLLSFIFISCAFSFISINKTNRQTLALTNKQSFVISECSNISSTYGYYNEINERVEDSTARNEDLTSSSTITTDAGELPAEYCLRDDYIIYTKDQDRNGYCWNFASTLAAETTIMKATNEYYDLSELWMGVSTYKNVERYSTIGDGAFFYEYDAAMHKSGLVLESDLPYSYSYIVSNKNIEDYFNFYNKYANNDLSSALYYDNKTCSFSYKDVNRMKNHIINHGSLFFDMEYNSLQTYDNGVFYKVPNQKNVKNCHAMSIIGWDDNFEKTLTTDGQASPTTFKGAWLILNSWGEDTAKDGISYIFYEDMNFRFINGFQFVKDTTRDLFFYDKIESGYNYTTNLKGKYYGDFVEESSLTKQKNIFYDDVNLEYSYEISEGTSIKSIDIYLDNINVTDEFTVSINEETKRFYISKENAEYGQHKIIVKYGNDSKIDTYLNNFIVTHGLVNNQLEYFPFENDFGFNEGCEIEYFSFSQSKKEYVLYTNKLSGQILFNNTIKSIYTERNIYPYILNYEITEGNSCVSTYSVTGKSGYVLNYNFNVEYYEDITLQNVNIFYDLGGGINHSKNYHKELANETTDLMLYEPTREGYTFEGWYLDYGNGSKKIAEVNDLHYIDWDDIHHMGENPSLYAKEHYQKYYNNSNTVFVYAHWKEVEYFSVDISIEGNGIVQPDKDILISSDDVITYYFKPDFKWCLSEVKINGIVVSNEELVEINQNGLTLKNVQSNISIQATFIEGVLIFLNIGENIKNAYLKINYNGEDIRFYNGDSVPLIYLNENYYFKFDLIVEVCEDKEGYTYILEKLHMYNVISKGVFTQVLWVHVNAGFEEINIGNAVKTQVEEVELIYQVNEYVLDHYLSTDINATSGTQSGSKFNLGEVIYIFIKKPLDTAQYKYHVNEYDYDKIDEQWYRRTIFVAPDNTNLDTIYVFRNLQIYSVIFKSWDGTNIYETNCQYGSKPEYYGDAQHLVRAEDEKYTYEFVGWNPILSAIKEDTTYIARFVAIPKQYVVSILPLENGTINHPNVNNRITCEDIFTYIFVPNVGYKIKEVKVNDVSFGAISNYTFKNVKSNQTISVEFEIQKFAIVFDCNGGTLANGILIQTVDYGSNAAAPLLTKDGYLQDGWDKPLTNIIEHTTIKAKWRPITYVITYDLMGGTNHSSNPTNYTIESNSIVLQNPTYEGYKFDGWYYNNNHTGSKVYVINQGSIGNLHLFAKFIAIKCSVVFDLGSSRFGNISCIHGDLENLEYGDNLTFEVKTDNGYEVDKVLINDVETAIIDNKFTVSNIKENTRIQVTYKESSSIVTPPNEDGPNVFNDTSGLDDATKYIIYAGIGLIVLLLSALIIIMSNNNKNKKKLLEMNSNQKLQDNSQSTNNHAQLAKKYIQPQKPNQTYNSEKEQQIFNNKSNTNQEQNPMLQKALNFVKVKQDNFVLFCNRYKINYQTNYNNAVLRYYQAYLRSIKTKQPPKNN